MILKFIIPSSFLFPSPIDHVFDELNWTKIWGKLGKVQRVHLVLSMAGS